MAEESLRSVGEDGPYGVGVEDIPVEGMEVFREPNRVREYFALEPEADLARARVYLDTQGNEVGLLRRIREQSPGVNGNVDGALEQGRLNVEQLHKQEVFIEKAEKEGLLKRILMAPLRFMKDHPILTIAAALGILYFTGAGAFLVAGAENIVGALPDSHIKEGLQWLVGRLGGATGTMPGVEPYGGVPPDIG